MKTALLWISITALAVPLLMAQEAKPETHGYFSFSYIKGQEASGYSSGSLEDLGGGLILAGLFTTKIEYRLEIRSRNEGAFALEEAWLGFNLASALNLRAGLYLVPFGRFNRLNRPHERLLVAPPLPVEQAYPPSWRDIGLLASGRSGFLIYAASVGNGLGEDEEFAPVQQFRDNNAAKDFTGRLGIQWKQGMETSISYSRQVFSADSGRRADFLGADASWITENYQVIGEYIRVEREAASEGKVKSEGWYVQLALDYKTLWPVASYQNLKESPPAGPALKTRRWTLGLAWAVFPGAIIKAEYAWNLEPGAEVKNNLLSLQLAAGF